MKVKIHYKKTLTVETNNLKEAANVFNYYPIPDKDFLVLGTKVKEVYDNIDYVEDENNNDITAEFIKFL